MAPTKTKCDLAEIPKVVVDRADPLRHQTRDAAFVLEDKWRNDCEQAFFCGIAHLLKHHVRSQAQEFYVQENSSKPTADPAKRLVRTFGWADEFFWLSSWRHTGEIHGPPSVKEMRDRFGTLRKDRA